METQLYIFGIVGGSASGKTEQYKRLMNKFPDRLQFSVSATTRARGEQEVDGVDYFFLSEEEFSKREANGDFLETNPFATGKRYGTLKSELDKARAMGKVLLLDIEIEGAKKIYDQYPSNSTFVFLDVEDSEAIRRLEQSGTRKREKIPERIQNLAEQRKLFHQYNFITLHIDTTGMSIKKIFKSVKRKFLNEIEFRTEVKMQ